MYIVISNFFFSTIAIFYSYRKGIEESGRQIRKKTVVVLFAIAQLIMKFVSNSFLCRVAN